MTIKATMAAQTIRFRALLFNANRRALPVAVMLITELQDPEFP